MAKLHQLRITKKQVAQKHEDAQKERGFPD